MDPRNPPTTSTAFSCGNASASIIDLRAPSAQACRRGFENEEFEMGTVIVGWHAPFAIVILAHQRIVDIYPGAPFGLHTRHVVATPSLLCGRGRQSSKFFTPVRSAGDAPATFGRFGEQHPSALGLRRVAADIRTDCGHILYELLLTAPQHAA